MGPRNQATGAPPPSKRTYEQILPRENWVAIGRSNCFIDVDRNQPNPTYRIAVDILKNTNFFGALTLRSTIPSIYLQQFWDTVKWDKIREVYSCQLDDTWYELTADTLREALQITPVDPARPFTSPPTAEDLIKFVTELGYPHDITRISAIITNEMYQPWRAIVTILNLCLTGKTSGYERVRAPILQILWGVVNQANIDYAERIWDEFKLSMDTFIFDKQNALQNVKAKKSITKRLIPMIRFSKLIIKHLQAKRKFNPRSKYALHEADSEYILGNLKFVAKGTTKEIFGKAIPDALITDDITKADYFEDYFNKSTKSTANKSTNLTPTKQTKTSSKSSKSSYANLPKKRQERSTSADPSSPSQKKRKDGAGKGRGSKKPRTEKTLRDEDDAALQQGIDASLESLEEPERRPRKGVTINEPRHSPPIVEGNGKGKAVEEVEQVAEFLLTISSQAPKTTTFFKDRPSQQDTSTIPPMSAPTPTPTPTPSATPSTTALPPPLSPQSTALPPPVITEATTTTISSTVITVRDTATPPPSPPPSKTVEQRLDEALKRLEALEKQRLPEIVKHHDRRLSKLERPNLAEVKDAVEWAMKAPLHKRFKDLPTSDMKEILHQRMYETDEHKEHEVHMQLYDALQSSMDRDDHMQYLKDIGEREAKKKRRLELLYNV